MDEFRGYLTHGVIIFGYYSEFEDFLNCVHFPKRIRGKKRAKKGRGGQESKEIETCPNEIEREVLFLLITERIYENSG